MKWWEVMRQWFNGKTETRNTNEREVCKQVERQELQRRETQAERRLQALEMEAQILQRRANVHNKPY